MTAERAAPAPPPAQTVLVRRLALAGNLGGAHTRPPARDPRMRWALLASGGGHALIVAVLLAGALLFGRAKPPEPDEPPHVEVLVDGGGAKVTGSPASPAPLSEAAPPVEAASQPAVPLPPAAPLPQAVPPAPPPPSEPDVPPQPAPPVQTAGVTPLPPPPPAPPPPVPAAPPVAAPPPPQMTMVQPPMPVTLPESTPLVRLGDGIAGPMAEILDAGKILRPAVADTGNEPPVYPLEAGRRGEHGMVTLRLTIGVDGNVIRSEVARSSGWPSLDRAARDGLAKWHFKPAIRDGLPQADVIELGVDFKLD